MLEIQNVSKTFNAGTVNEKTALNGRGEVKSVIAAESDGQITLYFSPISSRTLYQRAQSRTA